MPERHEWTVYCEADRVLPPEVLRDVELQLRLAVALPAGAGGVMSRRTWRTEEVLGA